MPQVLFGWIHLSDIHFGHGDAEYGWDQKLVLEQLKQDIVKVQAVGAPVPDAMLITGDVAFSGAGRSANEYDRAKEWLDAIAKTTKLEPKNMYIVPGNHDVSRKRDHERVVRSLLADLRSREDTKEARLDTSLANEGDRKLLAERMQAFLEFATNFGPWCNQQPLPALHDRLYWRKTMEARGGLRVRLVGLNTALVSADDTDEGKLQLGSEQLHMAVGETAAVGELVVVLTHHPLRPWLSDGKKAEQFLQSKAHVHIFGHVHDVDLQSVRHGSAKTFVRMIAGAAHAEREARGIAPRHGYNVAAVVRHDDGAVELRIWPRRWSEKKCEFRADMDLLEDGESSIAHPLALVLPVLPAAEKTPVMVNMTLSGSSQWLTGDLLRLWSGKSVFESRLRFEISNSAERVEDLQLDKPRTYHLGRTPKRADETTSNDCVLPTQRVSRDAAIVEFVAGTWWIQNTSKTSKLLVNATKVPFGEKHILVHGCSVALGDAIGEFRDGRYHPRTRFSAVDAQTGLLSAEGITCELGLALYQGGAHVLLAFYFGPDNQKVACLAAQVLHEADPAAPIGCLETTVAVLLKDRSRMAEHVQRVRGTDGCATCVAGYWNVAGPSTEAGARIEAAIGALARVAASETIDRSALIDLSRYALQDGSLEELTEFARKERATGGGMGLLLLDEFDHEGELGQAARKALELELREYVGGLLSSQDRIGRPGHGAMVLAARQHLADTLRQIVTGWRDKGPILIGKVEVPRSLRVLELDDAAAQQLVTNTAAFVSELGKVTNAPSLPTPIAYWLDAAQTAHGKLERGRSLLRTLEATWRMLGCIFLSAFWSIRKQKTLPKISTDTPWSAWSDVTMGAADALHTEKDRIGELAQAVRQAWQSDKGALRVATRHAAAISKWLTLRNDSEAIARETLSLELALHEVFAALRALRSWSLVAVRDARATDATGNVRRVDYIDFTGPHLTGIPRARTVIDMRIAEFVYVVRWAEGIAIPLVPFVRYEKLPDANVQALLFVDKIPTEPGFHEYMGMLDQARITLEVTERQLAR